MRKKWFITSAIVILLMFSFYGYLKIRQGRSYENAIHEKAALIFRLNTDQIIKTMVFDFLSHPAAYFKNDCESQDSIKKQDRGIAFPANIFVYNISGRPVGTYYCTLPVSDLKQLQLYVSSNLNIILKSENGVYSGVAKNGKLSVRFNKDKIAVAYSLSGEQVQDVLEELIAGTHMLSGDSRQIIALKKSSSVLSWANETDHGDVQFEKGLITAEGRIPFKSLYIPDQPYVRSDFPEKSFARGWLTADLHSLIKNQTFSWQGYKLNTDSLLKYHKNYIDFYIDGIGKQEETVVEYEYDDNFEKIATTNTKSVDVPDLNISVAAESTGLRRYLSGAGVLLDDQLNPKMFPLFKVYFDSGKDSLLKIKTIREAASPVRFKSERSFFYIHLNFEGLKKMKSIIPARFAGPVRTLDINGQKMKDNTAQFNIRLEFDDKNIHPVVQFLRGAKCR